jgi:hypothetical protein
MATAQNRGLLCNKEIFLLQVLLNCNILQFLTYPQVLQSKDTVDCTWWVISNWLKEMKSND